MDQATLPSFFDNYQLDQQYYDEMFQLAGEPRPHYAALFKRLLELSPTALEQYQQAADNSFLHQGITFTVYGSEEGTERIFPYDLLPRIITSDSFGKLEERVLVHSVRETDSSPKKA